MRKAKAYLKRKALLCWARRPPPLFYDKVFHFRRLYFLILPFEYAKIMQGPFGLLFKWPEPCSLQAREMNKKKTMTSLEARFEYSWEPSESRTRPLIHNQLVLSDTGCSKTTAAAMLQKKTLKKFCYYLWKCKHALV